ncbi:MAG: tetratricopeptide repeat protein [Candidatus Omnitrophota bacterium]
MDKKCTILLNLLLICAAVFIFSSVVLAEPVVLSEMEITENDAAVRVLFSTSKNTAVECYDLLEPPQVIVDFMGEIFTKQPEIMLVNKGVIKQMRIIKGTRKDTNLEEAYYPVDFIIVDLKEPMRYDFDQGLTTAVLVVAKPGKVATAALAKKSKEPVVEMPQQEIQAEPEQRDSISIWEEKEYEAEDVSFAAKKLAGEEPEAAKKETKTVAQPEKKKSAGKKVAQGIGSAGRGIKRFFTREKKEKKPKEPKEKKEVKQTKKERKIKKKKAEKKTTEITALQRKVALPPAEEEKIVVKKKKPTTKFKRKRMAAHKKPARIRKKKGGAGRVSDPEQKIEEVKIIKQEKLAELEKIKQDLGPRKAVLRKLEAEHNALLENIEAAKRKQEKPQKAFEQSVGYAELSQEAANSVWGEYTDAKVALSELLKQGAAGTAVSVAQEKYEEKKNMLEIAIKNAQTAQEKSDEMLLAYNKVKGELERAIHTVDQPHKELNAVKDEVEQLEQKMQKLQQEVNQAQNELEDLERQKQAYLLEKEEQDYKQFLTELETGSESKAELLKKEEERERAWADALQKLEKQRSQMTSKESAVAEAAKKEEKAKAKKIRKKRKKKDPEKTAAPVKKDDEGRKVKKLEKHKIEDTRGILPPKKIETPEKVVPDKKEMARADAELTKGIVPAAGQKTAKESAKKKAEAKESLETVLELRNIGLQMQKKGDLDGALKYYQKAIEVDPNYATVYNDMGILYEQKEMDEKAKMAYLNALKADPRYIRAHSNLALLYEKSGDYNKAYYHWKQRVELGKPKDPWTLKAKERLEDLEKKK